MRESFGRTDLQLRWRPAASAVGVLDGGTRRLFGINDVFNHRRLVASGVETSSRTGLARNVHLSIDDQF